MLKQRKLPVSINDTISNDKAPSYEIIRRCFLYFAKYLRFICKYVTAKAITSTEPFTISNA